MKGVIALICMALGVIGVASVGIHVLVMFLGLTWAGVAVASGVLAVLGSLLAQDWLCETLPKPAGRKDYDK